MSLILSFHLFLLSPVQNNGSPFLNLSIQLDVRTLKDCGYFSLFLRYRLTVLKRPQRLTLLT